MIGQFIQLDENRGDAGNIESQNRYAYALNNPNKYIDKNGRAAMMMCDGGSSGGIGGLIGAAGKLVKDIATKSPKKNQSTSQMTSQDRYNLWMGHDSWDNYGGKPKGVYATKADYDKAHQKPSTSYKATQTQDQRNPKAKTANTTRETYVPSPACSAIETLSKKLNDFKEEVLKGLNTVGKYIAKGVKAVGEFLDSILDVVAAAGALIVFAGGVIVAGIALGAIITALTGSIGLAATIGAFAAKGGMYVMYAGAIDMVLSGTQVLSGTLGCSLSGEKLTKEQAEQRINNGQTNLTLSYAGATFGYGATKAPSIVNGINNHIKDIQPNFANRKKLEEHFEKHKDHFIIPYKSVDDYLEGARDVMKNGIKVEYLYNEEIRTGYVRFMGNSSKGIAKFEFVGTNTNGDITTYHVESGKSFWKLLNGKNIHVINPVK